MTRKTLLSTTILAATLVFATPVAAQNNANTATGTKGSAAVVEKLLTTDQQHEENNAAASLLRHANYARFALGVRNNKLAETHINRAIELNEVLKAGTPERTKGTGIRAGQIKYGYNKDNKVHYFPLSDELVEWKELDRGPFWAENKGTAVEEVSLVYISYELDTSEADSKLKEALKDVREGKPEDAQQELSSLADGAVEVDKTTELPLAKARDNILLTHYFLRAGNYDAARHTLSHAEDGLDSAKDDDRYSKRSPQIVSMTKELNELEAVITKKDPTLLDKTEVRMKGWWQDLKSWSDENLG